MVLAVALLAMSETDKIEALLTVVERTDAVFVRGEKEADGHTTARQMRNRWHWQTSSIKSARDFIRVMTQLGGQQFRVRLRDGTEMKAADYLAGELDKIEARPRR
jgi:uncharacterized protein DUF5329